MRSRCACTRGKCTMRALLLVRVRGTRTQGVCSQQGATTARSWCALMKACRACGPRTSHGMHGRASRRAGGTCHTACMAMGSHGAGKQPQCTPNAAFAARTDCTGGAWAMRCICSIQCLPKRTAHEARPFNNACLRRARAIWPGPGHDTGIAANVHLRRPGRRLVLCTAPTDAAQHPQKCI